MSVERHNSATAKLVGLLRLGVLLALGWTVVATAPVPSSAGDAPLLVAGVDPKKKGERSAIDFRRAKRFDTTKTKI